MISELIWQSQIPIISNCFQQTLFIYIPIVYLFLFTPYEFIRIKLLSNKQTPWTLLNLSKILFTSLLIILNCIKLFNISLNETFTGAELISTILEILCFSTILLLILYQKKKNVHTSGVLFITWFLFLLFDTIGYTITLLNTFRSNNSFYKPINEFGFIYRSVHVAFIVSNFLLNCISDYKIDFNKKESCPLNRASFLSTLTFWWFNPMIKKGYKKSLVEQDMWQLDNNLKTRTIYNEFLKQFTKDFLKFKTAKTKIDDEKEKLIENKSDKESKIKKVKNVNIIYPFFRTYKIELISAASFKLIGVLIGFAQPLLLDLILNYIKTKDQIIWKGYFFAVCVLLASAIESILNNQYEYAINEVTMKIKAALTTLIYKKSLVLSSSGKKDFTTGEILNLSTIDLQSITEYILFANFLWASALQIVLATILIWFQLKVATISGIAVMCLMLIPNYSIGNVMKNQQDKQMSNKDERIKTLTEALAGIKVLKIYAWTEAFISRINFFRLKEVKNLRSIVIALSLMVFSFNCAPFLVSLSSFITYVFIYTDFKDQLDANKIFVSLSLFYIMRIPLGLIPLLVSRGVMCFVSIRRINKYLSSDELVEDDNEKNKDHNYPVKVKNGYFTWNDSNDSNDCTLKDINLKLKKGSLVAIVGQVGSGKSSLLSALLGEMKQISGELSVSDSISYIPQTSWILNKTIRQNILFNNQYDKKKYEDLIEKCQLTDDLKILTAGDETEIGEKGINLSGGQKQRVSIARAVYSDRSIYLFDDPLSALDSNVGKEIFDKIISNEGILKNKTRVLVTHRVSLLPKVDHIIVIKDGRISEQGSYSELMNRKGDFADLIIEFLNEAYQQENKEELDILDELPTELKNELPSLKKSKSQMKSQISASNKSINSSLRSIDSIKNESERSNSILSESKTKLENAKNVKEQQSTQKDGKLIQKEHLTEGRVSYLVYWEFIKAVKISWYLITFLCYVFSHTFNIFSQLWLAEWSNDSTKPENFNNTALRNKRLIGYTFFGSAEMVFVFFSTFIISLGCLYASQKIFSRMLLSVFSSSMSWFESVPQGRIINRFTKDIDCIDFGINVQLRGVLLYNFRILVSIILISLQTVYFLVTLIPITILYIILQTYYIATSRQLKRLESITRSPIYSHMQEGVTGAASIRAYNLKDKFIEECCRKVDDNHKIYYPNFCAVVWLTIRLEFLSYLIVFLASLFAIIFRDTLNPGVVGVAITSALTITANLNFLIKSFANLETNIVSVERCLEYTKLKSEKPFEIEDKKPNQLWPSKGAIEFIDYSTKYRPDLDLVLNSLSFKINSTEKIGVVGRTGAGKSTITLALFRIIEPVEGRIVIDDIDISQIGLNDLRSKLSIIPQDPVLFTGTIRFNLDPYNKYSDKEVYESIEHAHLKQFVNSLEDGIQHKISEGGENLSVGQRQLICLARALLRKSKILVLDEATASVDLATDELIQETIKSEFSDCTIITIAHRLNTIMDYDKVLVLNQGKIAEYDRPKALLEDKNTIFYDMAKKSGLI